MVTETRTQQRYDHRFRELVRTTGDIRLALQRGVPRSTARGWLAETSKHVVTIDACDMDAIKLRQEVLILRRRVSRLIAVLRVLIVVLRVSGYSINRSRLPDKHDKSILLRAIARSTGVIPLRTVLRMIDLSHSRYHSWRRDEDCGLNDLSSCPRMSPQQLTPQEAGQIKEMVTSDEFRHVPTGTLAILAQRMGRVFASSSTWYRLVRCFGWRRSRQRIHPAKPKTGIRAKRPDEIWHVDTTQIRLLDGTQAYLHAIIDNFSRRILSWKVDDRFHPAVTAELLLAATEPVREGKPTLLVDGGIENYNKAVNKLVDDGILKRLLAQTEINYSNSLIESWWRVLKHQWLFLNSLDTVSTVAKLVAFYVEQHNSHLPHSAFKGQTPDEMYFETGSGIPKQLQAAREAARQARLAANRKSSCLTCEPESVVAVTESQI